LACDAVSLLKNTVKPFCFKTRFGGFLFLSIKKSIFPLTLSAQQSKGFKITTEISTFITRHLRAVEIQLLKGLLTATPSQEKTNLFILH
jgi:hypothetical protein